MPVHFFSRPALTAIALVVSGAVCAQPQIVKPPVTQYWMDVSTVSMAGMEEVPGVGHFAGMKSGMSPGRWLNLAVATQRKPAGTQATQTIPPGQLMGASVTLMPVEPPSSASGTTDKDTYTIPEPPKGRILLYWGCGETVREGQPRVLDYAAAGPQEYARFMAGRGTRQRSASATPGNAIWPSAQQHQSIPKSASLVGKHSVSGEGLPASLQFVVPEAQDFMPALALTASGGGSSATSIKWPAIPTANAYFLNAMGGNEQDMVIWSSSELPEPGWGLLDYPGNANLEQWLTEKVLLPAAQTQCAIPAGIFAKGDGAMVQAIAYGQDVHLVYPARPTDRRQAWEPEWTAQIRVKSLAQLPLERGGGAIKMSPQKPLTPAIPGMPNVGGALKGLFGL